MSAMSASRPLSVCCKRSGSVCFMVAPVKVNGCVEAPLNHDGGLPPLSMVTPAAALLWGSLVGTATSAATGHRPLRHRRASPVITSSALSALFFPLEQVFCDDEARRSFIPRHQLQRAARRPAGPAPWPGTPDRAQPTRCMRRPPP